ncbi:MAG: BatD family protein [candidate division Zixibacteria bacterium]|nr:BatD family protein [candidate division Zixibacteria bacterium]
MRCSRLLATILVAVSTNPVDAEAVPAPQEEDDAFSIVASVDRDRITVGDPFLYLITVRSPGNAAIEWPEAGRPPEGFDLVSFEHEGPLPGPGGANIDLLRYELTLYRTGEHTIPPFSLKCVLSDGTEVSAESEAVPFSVVSVIDDDAADIRDLKSPVDIPGGAPWYYWLIAGLVLLAVAAAVFLYIRRRRNREDPQGTVPAIERPPEEIALEELERLALKEWLTQGRVKAHYSALSEILRRYLSGRYGIAAMEYTTSELLAALNARQVGHEESRVVRELFEECDMVKFARFTPETHRQSLSLREGREIVERTRPPEVPDVAAMDEPANDDSSVAGEALDGDAGSVQAPAKD